MSEKLLVRRAAVLGAGVMGAQIAAHLATFLDTATALTQMRQSSLVVDAMPDAIEVRIDSTNPPAANPPSCAQSIARAFTATEVAPMDRIADWAAVLIARSEAARQNAAVYRLDSMMSPRRWWWLGW